MNNTFSTILNKHEADDNKQANKEELIMSAMKEEFANSEEIFALAKKLSISLQDVMAGKITNFPITPIRQSDKFYIKKHTESQIPYFHYHNFYEIIYVHRGKSRQIFKNGSNILLTEGQCLLLFPSSIHLIERSKPSDIILKIVIPSPLFEQIGSKFFNNIHQDSILFKKVSITARFAILKLLEEQSHNTKFKDLIIQSYLTLIFIELVSSQNFDLAIETMLNDYFNENIKTANLVEFALSQNYNPNYMGRLIKKKTGQSFSKMLNLFRLTRAQKLLTDTDLTIEEISYELGYSSPSGLYRLFYATFGIKPNEYRNLLK